MSKSATDAAFLAAQAALTDASQKLTLAKDAVDAERAALAAPPIVPPAPVPAPLPVPPSSGISLAGWVPINQQEFDQLPVSRNVAGYPNKFHLGAWNVDTALKNLSLGRAPNGKPQLEYTYPVGLPEGVSPANLYLEFAERSANCYRLALLRLWLTVGATFRGHPSGINKLVHFLSGSPASNQIFLMMVGADTAPLIPMIGIQRPAVDGGTVNVPPRVLPGVRLIRGQEHLIEVVLDLGTAAVPTVPGDGRVAMYVDGALVLQDGPFGFSGGYKAFSGVRLDPTYGGRGPALAAPTFTLGYRRVEWFGRNS